jgi:hypothetical protein
MWCCAAWRRLTGFTYRIATENRITFAKNTNINKTNQYLVQKSKSEFKQNWETKMIYQSIFLIYQFINRFSILPINFILQNNLSSSFSIYQSIFDFLCLKKQFSCSKTSYPIKSYRTNFIKQPQISTGFYQWILDNRKYKPGINESPYSQPLNSDPRLRPALFRETGGSETQVHC